jgi:uncharacterized membrane protein
MNRRGLLFGEYWMVMYTAFFSIILLVFFVLKNPDKDRSQEILANVNDGKDALNSLARRSMAANRCSTLLNVSDTWHLPCILS